MNKDQIEKAIKRVLDSEDARQATADAEARKSKPSIFNLLGLQVG